MSQQGLIRAQQFLQVVGQQLPSIAQASQTPGIMLDQFINGVLARSGFQPDLTSVNLVGALAQVIEPPVPQPVADPTPPST